MGVIGNFQLATGQAAYGGGAGGNAAVNVGLGFVPKYVKVFSFDTHIVTTEFIKDDETERMKQGVKTVITGSASCAVLTENGIVVGDVVVDPVTGRKEKGFTIGTACQINSKPFIWIALG